LCEIRNSKPMKPQQYPLTGALQRVWQDKSPQGSL
jgi:hypothetical protein